MRTVRLSEQRSVSDHIGPIEEYAPGRFRVRAKGDAGQVPVAKKESPVVEVEKYDSKTEAAYAQHLEFTRRAGAIAAYWHHPFSLRLPGQKNRYTPDFLVQHLDGTLEVKETKGWSKNLREGITKFKTGSGVHTYIARWTLVTREDGQWVERRTP